LVVLADPGHLIRTLSPSARLDIARASGSERGGGMRAPSKKRRIAIVEDEQDLLRFYTVFLKGLGYDSILAVVSGEELVQAVSDGRSSPEVVIMDYRLPGLDGIEIAKRLVALRPGTKVIVTTADDSVRSRADSLGFLFLQKPFSIPKLVAMID
jgi:DNA-binding response OmpR family regulator